MNIDYATAEFRISANELARVSRIADTLYITFITRPQPNGKRLVVAINVDTKKVFGSYYCFVDSRRDIRPSIRRMCRAMNKLGFEGMTGPSRLRKQRDDE